ncbi:MAG: prokaryotic E2 ligase family D protein [Anaerolineae bacterium]|nr:prokaryotic E2 ligase family D protein [Anaerolineae bacterium]
MNMPSDWSGRVLTAALTEQPSLILSFYSFGVMLRKTDGEQTTEYPIDPAQVALALAAKVTFDTGLLGGNTLLVRQDGVKRTVVEYRPPQKTGLFLDGSEAALRVPLPALVMIRVTAEDKAPVYGVYAVKRRPETLDIPLFHAPLPNVFGSGAICWGTVQRVTDSSLQSAGLAEDWTMLLGSSFGDHAVGGKSKRHKQDIRKLLIDLEARKARRYPTGDLIPVKKTLAQVLGGVS